MQKVVKFGLELRRSFLTGRSFLLEEVPLDSEESIVVRPKNETPTPGELEVLKILWRRGPCTVREVMDELNQTRKRAYTSVMSLLNVMTDKELLTRSPKGRAFLYTAELPEDAMLGELVQDLLRRAFEGSASAFVAQVLDQSTPSEKELDEIHQTIQQYREGDQP
jgi:predicted transcriptional regulator